jgi:hypothetical protein
MTERPYLRWKSVAFGLALLWTSPVQAQPPVPPPATWLFTSDIHFNPLDDPRLADQLAAAPITQWDAIFATSTRPPTAHGKDTNDALLRLALAQMRLRAPDPAVVSITGDFLVHSFRGLWNVAASDRGDDAFDAFVDKTVAYLALEFDAAFPHAQFVITLGNNDSACGDYAAMPRSAFLANFARAWAPLVDRDGRAPDFVREFPIDGDYVVPLANGMRIIAVNSNVWSPVAANTCDPDGSAQTDVMTWFEQAVAAAPAGARTWALLHVPPGIDAYSASRTNLPVPFYRPELLARFRAVRASDGKPLGLIVAGHLHNDGFRIVDRTPLVLVPSISPVHGNNPAFFVARVDGATGTIGNYTAYALDENGAAPGVAPASRFAPEYEFNASYGVHGFTLASLQQLEQAIHDDAGMRQLEADHYVSGSSVAGIDAKTWHAYWCANVALDPGAFEACSSGP